VSDNPITPPILEQKIVESSRTDIFFGGGISITSEIGLNAKAAEIGAERAKHTWPAVAASVAATLIGLAVVGGIIYALSRTQDTWAVMAGLAALAAVGGPVGWSVGKVLRQFGAAAEKALKT